MAILDPIHWEAITPAMRELMAVASPVFFENADQDVQPSLLVNLPWEEIKQFFIAEAQALGKTWFGEP